MKKQYKTVRVFGSASVWVTPDTAVIVVAVSRLQEQPAAAFTEAREGAQQVTRYLRAVGVEEFSSSRVSLSQEQRHVNGEYRYVGYQARLEFQIFLRDLDRTDEIVSGLIAAGANQLQNVTFQTTRLKELRADARRRAVASAREKAELYCEAAGVSLGGVLVIEDVNPESLSGRYEGHSMHEAQPVVDDSGETAAIDPGAITVAAAVNVVYRLSK